MKILFTFLLCISFGCLFAQPNQPDQYPDPNQAQKSNSDYRWSWEKSNNIVFTPPPTPIPVDGGLGGLIAVGTLWGVNRLRKHKKKASKK